MKVLAVIPARGGSKGIPGKNLADCAGKPLLAHTCSAAIGSTFINKTIISTDDPKIAAAAKSFGVEAPFLRPSELAQDSTPMIDVLKHAVDFLENSGFNFDTIVLLQPTSPLRNSSHIDAALKFFETANAQTVVSVIEVPHQFNPFSILKDTGNMKLEPWQNSPAPLTRRQDKPKVYARNGPAILICRPENIKKGQLYAEPVFGFLMDKLNSVDIDDPIDLSIAQSLLSEIKSQ